MITVTSINNCVRDVINTGFYVSHFRPSTTDNTGTEYHYAEKMGRLNLKECSTLYVKCPLSILDLFTIVTDYYNVRQNPPIFAMWIILNVDCFIVNFIFIRIQIL